MIEKTKDSVNEIDELLAQARKLEIADKTHITVRCAWDKE